MSFQPSLNRRLDLEDRVMIPDGAGGFAVSWSKLGTLPAMIRPRTGSERSIGERTVSRTGFRITVRAAPDGAPSRPKPEQRFRDGTRVYDIRAVAENSESALYLDCWAEEGVDA